MAKGAFARAALCVPAAAIILIQPVAPPRVAGQGLELLVFPKTLVDRAIEARSMTDIAKDNEIVLKVNGVMADLGTLKASTRVYEQRLLVTGLFDDKATYDKFEQGVRKVPGVKALYWHVIYMPKADQERRKLMAWGDVLVLETKAEGRLIGASGVADVNFRIAGNAFGTLYLLGRARSKAELTKAGERARDGERVRKLVTYGELRP